MIRLEIDSSCNGIYRVRKNFNKKHHYDSELLPGTKVAIVGQDPGNGSLLVVPLDPEVFKQIGTEWVFPHGLIEDCAPELDVKEGSYYQIVPDFDSLNHYGADYMPGDIVRVKRIRPNGDVDVSRTTDHKSQVMGQLGLQEIDLPFEDIEIGSLYMIREGTYANIFQVGDICRAMYKAMDDKTIEMIRLQDERVQWVRADSLIPV